jgi:geranylgeranyl diphosphate synthase type I
MRIELMAGQFLDVREAGEPKPSLARSLKIARFKSGKYTIERPLQFGAVLAQPQLIENSEFLTQLSKIGIPLGEAFQMRDDILGIFGDPKETGKPAGDDLREGKRTALIALAVEGASDAGRKLLQGKLGKPDLTSDEVDALRTVIQDSGAVSEIESLISELTAQTHSAIASDVIAPQAQEILNVLVVSAVSRKS